MNAFLRAAATGNKAKKETLARGKLSILQLNLGNLCNQSCMHCHVAASPDGKNSMSKKVADEVIAFLKINKGLILDITGGAPELSPCFDYLVEKSSRLAKEVIVRSNLTVILEPGKSHLPALFKKNKVHLICSLPCYTQENVDAQRGRGVFAKSIKAMAMLNKLGFARDKKLLLDIVYNPGGAFIPGEQKALEADYRANLKKYGVAFNRLVTIANVPLSRFREFLDKQGGYAGYIEMLKSNFNPDAAWRIMCRSLLSVGFDGRLYDCDFNQSLGWALKDKAGGYLRLASLKKSALKKTGIIFGEHCFSCTAGQGSSCQGALVKHG